MDNAGQRLHLRVERQTLSRLPKSNAVLFTIRTYMDPLSTFEGRPDRVCCSGVFDSLAAADLMMPCIPRLPPCECAMHR